MIINDQYNIGHICTRQQCDQGRGDKVAMRWISQHMEQTDYSFLDLERESNRFANVLQGLGFQAGDAFFTLLPKMPEQFFSFLGTLKLQAVAGTLFSNFGEEALLDRLGDSRARGIITKKSFLKKLSRIRAQLPDLTTIILVDIDEHQSADVLSYSQLMSGAPDQFTAPPTPPVRRRFCTTPRGPPGSRRGCSTCTARSFPRTAPPGRSCSSPGTRSTGARPTRGG